MLASTTLVSVLGFSSVYGLALDRLPKFPVNHSFSSPDLLVRTVFPPAPNTILYYSRSSNALPLHKSSPITKSKHDSANINSRRSPTTTVDDASDPAPTPAPTGDPNPLTTVHVTDESDFALLLPNRPHGKLDFLLCCQFFFVSPHSLDQPQDFAYYVPIPYNRSE